MKLDFDCVIIGAGVAGMTSALYLKRAGINVLIIEKNYVGGQINKTYTIQNYPGFLEIDGPTLALAIEEQIKKLEVPIIYEEVLDIINNQPYKQVVTNKKKINTKSVIIATGKQERKLGLEGEKELAGHGISYCATCDGAFFKDQTVAVVGSGNTAMEDVIYLSNICSKVYLINRSDSFKKADQILYNQVSNKNNVEILLTRVIDKLVVDDGKLVEIDLSDKTKLKVNGLFVAIGSIPNLNFISNIDLETENGYIVVDNNMKTSVDSIYACGDIIKKDLYQIVTAASDGAIAANSVKKDLLER